MLWSKFSPIFGEKMAFFSKTKCYDQNFRRFSPISAKKLRFSQKQCFDQI
jgi:hypothetical protein